MDRLERGRRDRGTELGRRFLKPVDELAQLLVAARVVADAPRRRLEGPLGALVIAGTVLADGFLEAGSRRELPGDGPIDIGVARLGVVRSVVGPRPREPRIADAGHLEHAVPVGGCRR